VEGLIYRAAEPAHVGQLATLRHSLWPDASLEDHAAELALLLAGNAPGSLPVAVLIAQDREGHIAGFVEVGLRSHADGCDPSQPVGYLEGWYVSPEWRRRGVGGRLIAEAEAWARRQGCREMASDTWIDNLEAQHAHGALGYEVVDRCVNYRKLL
jgi:aminoglycoside 6'-N-acetyltransferase I